MNELLVESDIEGLIENGAPKDEYFTEAEQIVSAINQLEKKQINEENILAIISLVWMRNFELSVEELKLRANSINEIIKKLFS